MFAYIVRRVVYAIPVLIGVNLITFALFFGVNSPQDIARMHVGVKRVSQAEIQNWMQAHGYARPLLVNEDADGLEKFTDSIFYHKSDGVWCVDFGRFDSGPVLS